MKPATIQFTGSPGEEDSDARVELVVPDGTVVARATLWWHDTPVLNGARIGTIGGFTADDADAARRLLDEASRFLSEKGCRMVVGPMNGNTWRRHRFVVESNGRGPFLLEPRNPAEHPAWWEAAGFSILSRYSSSVMRLDDNEGIPEAIKQRLERSGISVRRLEPGRYDEELTRIYSVSLKSFANNFLYTPLDESGFMDAYRKIRDKVDPDFVRIAERDGIPCGFVFGIPDLEAASRGENPALIVKTLAVDPEARCAGLGSWLVGDIHRAAFAKGFVEAIHALQHESNTSLKITGRHHGEVFRRYALFSKSL